ncbi:MULTISPECIES: urease accessory protein UreD [unclassified Mesorhizobium]|uniref:urease accessory protein UreD n=1 Tax=unclassified Mesorhizobium TaxID=325217 RepID=UPI00112E7CE3|nr:MULTISPECIES: urease accessory protein UreD [unclassified Mesorhizobium]TPK94853.1 urease accessory protein UreD [Mesorhizobium sp. B2-4-16]TPL62337.1 urease accessory protein UreD [Mesorhizobium sp. B2-4-3]
MIDDTLTSQPASPLAAPSLPAAQRVAGLGRLFCGESGGRTRLRRLYQDGSAKIRLPAVQGDPLEAVLINTAGGLTGGDRLGWMIEVGAGASAAITTQACEKVYRAAADRAETSVRLRVDPGGRLAWLPQETIVFDRAAFARTLDVELGDDAEALVLEATLFGRLAMGERTTNGSFHDRWRVRRGGALIHAEDFRVGPDIAATLRRPAAAGGALAVATLLLVSPQAESLLEPARAIIGDPVIGGWGGASFWRVGRSGKLLARLCAGDGYQLRKRLVPLVELLNGRAGLPKLWSL